MSETTSRRDRRTTLLLEQLRGAREPIGLGEIMQRAKLHPGERTEVKRVLRSARSLRCENAKVLISRSSRSSLTANMSRKNLLPP